jgi:hypothetical protein
MPFQMYNVQSTKRLYEAVISDGATKREAKERKERENCEGCRTDVKWTQEGTWFDSVYFTHVLIVFVFTTQPLDITILL